jgi:ABC-2 type transport system ATP-binding protein
MTAALELSHVSKQYKNFQLNDITFSLPKGCIMGLIGDNGAGKTTTIKLILDQVKKSTGTIRIDGLDSKNPHARDHIGVVLDECHFHEMLRPAMISTIMRGMCKNWDDDLFRSYLSRLSVPNKTVKEFSKGMKMKLSIAAALAHHPKLLILDEATAGLDPVVRNDILDIFYDFIQDEEHSILMSTHITSDLEQVADYITFLHNGQLILSDTKDSIDERFAVLKCGALSDVDKSDIIRYRKNRFGHEILVSGNAKKKYRNLISEQITLETLMLFYAKGESI